MITASEDAWDNKVRRAGALDLLRLERERLGDHGDIPLTPARLAAAVAERINVASFVAPWDRRPKESAQLSGLRVLRKWAAPLCERWAEQQKRRNRRRP